MNEGLHLIRAAATTQGSGATFSCSGFLIYW